MLLPFACSHWLLLFHIPRYEAGDHVAVYPTNDPELVEKLGQMLQVDLDTVISLNNNDGESTALPKLRPFEAEGHRVGVGRA